jgi:beta-lactamase regulating signal transducer with metallopeptidase domain
MLLLKATLVLALAALSALALRRSPGATRHRLWSWAFVALLALPVLVATLPTLNVPVASGVSTLTTASPDISPASPMAAASPAAAMPVASAEMSTVSLMSVSHPWGTREVLSSLWLMGSLLSLMTLAVSVLRVHWLSRSARLVLDPAWTQALTSIARQLVLPSRVDVRISPRVVTPMAGGFLRPTVFLPSDAVGWSAERRSVVLAHELAHLAARDPQRQLLARVALSLYWFHPLAWFAARQATAAREAACDEQVLSLGTKPSTYAQVLLDLAASIQSPPRALATLPMVHKSSLEVRVMAILNDTVRPNSTIRGTVAVLALAVGTVVVAAAAPRSVRMDSTVRWVEVSPSAIASSATLVSPPVGDSPAAAVSPATLLPRQRDARATTECAAGQAYASFSGRIDGSRNAVYEQVGTLDGTHRIILFTVDAARLCLLAENVGPADPADRPSSWIGTARRVVMQASSGNTTQRLVIEGGNTQQATWQVNGASRPIDSAATEWRNRMLAIFDAHWELSTLRGQVTSLRGQITSIHGEETSLRGQITSLQGEVTSMHGRITSIRGEETSMRGRITSIRGHETSLRGQITSARGAITSIQAGYRANDADRRIADYERQIERIEKEIRDYNADARVTEIEKEIERFDADRKAAEVEKRIKEFDLDRKVADVERRILELEVEKKVKNIEQEIDNVDYEKRAAEIERRIEAERPRLKAAIAAVR